MKVRSHFLVPALCLLAVLFSATGWSQSERWVLSYGRQYGINLTAGSQLAELFAAYENGVDARVGMTNDGNPNTAIFGYTNPASNPFTPGNLRVLFQSNVYAYDFHAYDPPVPSDRSPNCYWQAPLPNSPSYKFEFWWRKVSDDSLYTMRPFTPVYHYDRVNGFNTSTTEAPNYHSDAYELPGNGWADYHAQTFVVPANINRIIGAKAFAVRGAADPKFRMRFTIHEGGPTGPQVGPAVTSREVNSNEFQNVRVTWGMEAVPVTPGGTYAVRVEPPDGQGFNMYVTQNDNYSDGILYRGATPIPGNDMVGVVIGASRNSEGLAGWQLD